MMPADPRDRRPQRVAVVGGDGIGPEVVAEAVKVVEAAADRWHLPLVLCSYPWSADRYLETGEGLPPGALATLRDDHAAILLGAFGDPRIPDMRHAAEILLGLRFGLDLYVNFRPCRLLDPRLCPLRGKTEREVDFVIFRENTEGAYAGVGGQFKRGTADEVAVEEAIHTRKGVERIVRAAFAWARAQGRGRLCLADKSNALRFGHDLWQRVFAEVREEYPEIDSRHLFVDTLAMQLVRAPEQFEVIVTDNLFGDLLSDLGAGLVGGLGVVPSANLRPGGTSLFEPVHGSAPKHAGTGRANPVGAILSAALMLDALGHAAAARAVEAAVTSAVRAGETTPDLGGGKSTSEVGDAVARAVASGPREGS